MKRIFRMMSSAAKALIIFATVLPMISCAHSVHAKVKAWEGEFSMPTWELGPGDPNPQFHELSDQIIYPYAMQDAFTANKSDKSHRAFFLENKYLKVMVFPHIGGRIMSWPALIVSRR